MTAIGDWLSCPECHTQFIKNAANHVFCGEDCARREQRRRRKLRKRGILPPGSANTAPSPSISVEQQRELAKWENVARHAEMNGMTIEEWIASGKPNSADEAIRQSGYSPTRAPTALADALKASGYDSRIPPSITDKKDQDNGKS